MRKMAILAAGLCAVASVAEAQDGGFYFGGYGFTGMTQEFETSRRGVQGTFNLNPPFLPGLPPANDAAIPTDIQDILNTILNSLTYADSFFGGFTTYEGTVAPASVNGFGATLGYATGNGLRFELEASRFMGATTTDTASSFLIITSSDTGTWTWDSFGPLPGTGERDGYIGADFLLGNIWLGLGNGPIVPYLGGGAGLARVTFAEYFDPDVDETVSVTGTGFGFQAGAGVLFNLGETVAIDIGYRFKGAMGVGGTADYEMSETNADEYDFDIFTFDAPDRIGIHTFSIGLIFNF